MSSADAHLYGIRKPKNKAHEISSSTTLSFTSTLSSLLSTSSSSNTTAGRARSSNKKSDIFSSHNKGSKKRALKDISDDASSSVQIHSKTSEEVDSSLLHRSKRKMEEKARLYAAMKRGDYIPREGEKDEKGSLIDFDRKWAETKARGEMTFETESDDGGDSDSDSSVKKNTGKEEEMVEYEDEFGRVRKITKSEATKREKARLRAEAAALELSELRARPTYQASSNIIYGPIIQTAAFNPDASTAQKMEEIAKKRDRSATPPPEQHYEADKEIRSKGVGFYSFSKDEEVRKKEMEALEEERRETERKRVEREERKKERVREVEERRRVIAEKRARREADRFLDALVAEGDGGVEES